MLQAASFPQNKQEEAQYKKIVGRIEDLEERTIIALETGKKKIAREAAETIAFLEAERDTSKAAMDRFQSEIDKLKSRVRNAETRLGELKRGHRLADATDKTQRMRSVSEGSTNSALGDAEETLLRLRMRQKQMDATEDAMREMEQEGNAEQVIEKLAAAGCGAPLSSSADDVLKRLSKKTKKSA